MNTHVVTHENQDSIEIGTPGKGGVIKIYGNAADPEGFKQRIKNMKEVRAYAQSELSL